MDEVWIVTSGEYENYGIDGVYANPAQAVAGIKARYPEPYRVEWEEPRVIGDDWELVGHFAQVPGYSTKHTASYDIERWEVDPTPASG